MERREIAVRWSVFSGISLKALQCFDNGVNQSSDQEQSNEGSINVLPFVILSSDSIYTMINSGEKEKENEGK